MGQYTSTTSNLEKKNNKGIPGGYPALDQNQKVVQAPASASMTPGPNLIPIADTQGKLNMWVDGGGTPSPTVTEETYFGQSPSAGTAPAYSRGDHTHGTPANPVTGHEQTFNHNQLHSNALDHSHSNKATLDTYAQTETNLADAVSKKHSNSLDHTQNTDTGTSSSSFVINGANAIKEGDSRLTDARTPLTHSHAISDTTGLQTALDNKLPSTSFSGLAKITIGSSPPGSPGAGDLWIDTS